MKKSIYMAVLGVLTVICMIIGIARFGWVNFKRDGLEVEKTGAGCYEKQVELEAFESLEWDIDVADVTVKKGNIYSISYQVSREVMIPEYKVSGGVLNIQQTAETSNLISVRESQKAEIEVTIPENVTLKSINGSSGVADTKFVNLTCEKTNLTSGMGDMEVKNSVLGDMEVDISTGDFKMSDCETKELILSSDMGDIKLEAVKFDSLDIESSVGEVKVESVTAISYYSCNLKTDVGEVEVEGKGQGRSYQSTGEAGNQIRIQNNLGDIELEQE